MIFRISAQGDTSWCFLISADNSCQATAVALRAVASLGLPTEDLKFEDAEVIPRDQDIKIQWTEELDNEFDLVEAAAWTEGVTKTAGEWEDSLREGVLALVEEATCCASGWDGNYRSMWAASRKSPIKKKWLSEKEIVEVIRSRTVRSYNRDRKTWGKEHCWPHSTSFPKQYGKTFSQVQKG